MPFLRNSAPLSFCFSFRLLGSLAKRLITPVAYGAALCALLPACSVVAVGQVNIYTKSFDISRTGANLNETILTPANVNAASFGKLYTVPTDGQVYAQPLFVSGLTIAGATHDVVFVATMSNSVYAIDGPTGQVLWQKNFGTPVVAKEVDTVHNIAAVSGIGILSTPVIDPQTNYMYFVTANESVVNAANVYAFNLHVIDIRTGLEAHASAPITATYSTADLLNPLVFTPAQENQRGGLALANGNVYFAFASHDDHQPYHGWVLAYNATTLQQVAVYSDTTTGIEGGIWNAGGAPNVDTAGNIYLSTGNGTFGKTTNGLVQTGNSFIKLSPQLQLLDYFTPTNSAKLNSGDQDLGSSGLLMVPNTNYILGGGKQGVFYLADINNLGKFDASEDEVRQEFQAIYGKGTSHIHGTPTYFESNVNGPSVFVWGENDVLRGFQFNVGTGMVITTPFGMSTMTAPVTNNNGAMPGGFTSISANGKKNGIVWASTPFDGDSQFKSREGVLYAFDANTLQLLWTDKTQEPRDEVGLFAKYVQPVVANGRMFVPTFGSLGNTAGTGQLVAYGLLPVLTVNVADATVVAGAALPKFTGTVAGLAASDTLGGSVVVTYTTTATTASPVGTYPITATVSGTSSNNYKVVVNAGTLTVTAPAGGGGTPPTTGTNSFSYPTGFAGSKLQLNGSAKLSGKALRLVDGGTYETSSAYYPNAVNVQGFVNDFTYQLTNPAADGFTMLFQNDGLTAMGGYGIALGFGAGSRPNIVKGVAVKFDLYNNNGEGTNSTGLYVGGQAPTSPAINLNSTNIVLKAPGVYSIHAVYDGALLNVTITNTNSGATATQSYAIDIPAAIGSSTGFVGFSAGTGYKSETADILSWSYSAVPAYRNGFSTPQLSLNGGAALNGSALRLIDGGNYEARSAFFNTPVNLAQFKTAFTIHLTNANADGLVFALQGVGPTAVGGAGSAMGIGPILNTTGGAVTKSVYVKFDLYNNKGEGADSTGIYTNGANPTLPATSLSGTGIDLHKGNPLNVTMTYDGTTLTVVLVDTVNKATATQSYKVNIPQVVGAPTGYVGFTAGSGGESAIEEVQSWTYAPGPIIKPQLVYSTVTSPSVTSGPELEPLNWAGFSDGKGTEFESMKVGDQVAFTINVPAGATYDIAVNSQQLNTRSIGQLAVDGLNLGAPIDEYGASTTGVLRSFDLGKLTLNAGMHTFAFTVAGRHAGAAGWSLSFGQLTLTAQ